MVLLHINYIIATTSAFIFGVLLSYSLNSIYVFHKSANFKYLLKYCLVYIITYFLNVLILIILVENGRLGKIIAQIITSCIVMVVNFYLIKKKVFIQ